ncbi:hypothetical protein QFZ65_002436 [Arthrobacter sp. B3I9]|uniref:hypothetical protein n=1 Tax=Arthrobacter sp. B3I9 TaxID=3042270 RepID=UPI00278F5395|nr:hypothetical protein [Arthrobacter sp. B3I9]MDQ0850498.1 hypothetical protein [Arthrobacter sp. B3I9]
MKRKLKKIFWWEAAGAVASAALFILTLFNRDWIEVLFGVEPDGGSGSMEWAVVVVLAALTLLSVAAVSREWHRSVIREVT